MPVCRLPPTAIRPRRVRGALGSSAGSMRKEIQSQVRLKEFKSTPAYTHLVEFIQGLAEAVAGKSLTDECAVSPPVQCLLDDLEQMKMWVAELPPLQQAMRYGNKAFIAWHRRLCELSKAMATKLLGIRSAAADAGLSVEQASLELAAYLEDSFGNATRIDYGTGHELAFAAFLCAAERVGSFTAADRPALVLRVFQKYLELMRLLQSTYYLEPAGSHGVWGLDDYQHLCFFFGAAQLSQQREIAPSAVHDADLLEDGHGQWMYLAAVRFIQQVKKGPFREHSPYLSDISGVDSWLKIGVGLLRMYEVEVLGKLPVVQHLAFGKLLPWADASGGGEGASATASGAAPSSGNTDAIRRGSYGTAPPSGLPDNRLAVLAKIQADKKAAAAAAAAAVAAAAPVDAGPPSGA